MNLIASWYIFLVIAILNKIKTNNNDENGKSTKYLGESIVNIDKNLINIIILFLYTIAFTGIFKHINKNNSSYMYTFSSNFSNLIFYSEMVFYKLTVLIYGLLLGIYLQFICNKFVNIIQKIDKKIK